jgi:site-specific DNA recombinase
MTRKKLALDAYVRVSDRAGREGDSFQSPGLQREAIERYAAAHGHTIAAWHEDIDQSGAKMDRPAFGRMMARVETGQTQGVIVAKLDRFARSLTGALGALKKLERHGCELISVADNIDSSTPTGRLMRDLILRLAEWELERITEGWSNAQAGALARGAFIGKAPLGLRKMDGGRLEIDPCGPDMTEAYRRAARDGLHAGAERLGIPITDARRVFANRIYLGEMRYNGTVVRDACEPVTDLATWTAAQTEPRFRAGNGEYPLSQYARCGSCGGPMVGQLQHSHGKTYRRYRCSRINARTKGTCDHGASISAEALEALVRATLVEVLADGALKLCDGAGGLEAVERVLRTAEGNLELYASDVELQETLGMAAFRAGALKRRGAVEEARKAYQDAAAKAQAAITLPAASELGDDKQMVRAVDALVAGIDVTAGRGNHRVSIRWS